MRRSCLIQPLVSAVLALLLAGALGACAPASLGDPDGQGRALERARADLVRRPSDVRARRDLGALLAQAEQFAEAEPYLRQAYVEDTGDPTTLYYLGLVVEAEGNLGEALRYYGRFTSVSPRSPFRSLLEGRYERVTRERLRAEIAAFAAREDEIAADSAARPATVAVFPFAYLGSDPRYAPVGLALSELVTADLAGLGALQVVERLRVQALLDELALGQGRAFDASTTPRLGRLLRAGRAVGGAFDVADGDLRVDAALWDWEAEPVPDLQTRSAALGRLFELKREIVLAVVQQLAVPLTPQERAALDVVPTRNIQAFLLYARGLQEEDAGRYGPATTAYRQAAKLDPGFGAAAAAAGRSAAAEEVGASIAEALAATPLAKAARGRRVQRRSRRLNDTVGGAFLPGGAGRNPGAEVATGTGTATEPLPDPPDPPGGN